MPPNRRKRKIKDPFAAKPSAAMYLGYVDDNESVEEIMKKFQVLDEIEQNKKKEMSTNGINNNDDMKLNDKDLEEIFHKTSSYAIEAAIDNSYFYDDSFSDNYSESDAEWDDRYAYSTESSGHKIVHRVIDITNGGKTSSWKETIKELASQALSVCCYSIDNNNHIQKYGTNYFPNDVDVVKVPKDIPQTWYTPIRPFSSHTPLSLPFSQHLVVDNIPKYNYSNLNQTFQGILITPPWDRITPKALSDFYFPMNVIPTGIIFIWVDKKYISDVLSIMEKKNFYYVENVNWMFKDPNNIFISYDSDSILRQGKRTMLLFRRGQRKSPTSPIDYYSLQLRHQRTTDVYIGSKPQEQHKQYSNGYEYIYNLIETLLPDGNYNETTKTYGFLELWGQPGYTRKGWTVLSETQNI